MNHLWELTKLTLQTFSLMVTDLQYLVIIALVFALVYRQNVKILDYEQRFFNLKRMNPLMETATSLVYGLLGGFLATILFIALGVSVSDAGVGYLWLAALLLMLIHPRFLCFAYAGSLVSMASLMIGYPQVQVASLMALVGILHLVEAVLIYINGYHQASPVFLKSKEGTIVGGFTMRKFWPMPTIALVGAVMAGSALDWASVPMPDWWPLFNSTLTVPEDHILVHFLFPLVVALGYSDFVQTELPKTKARRSAVYLFFYSVILLSLAIVANRMRALVILPVIFAPLGHELVIYWGQRRERLREPVFHSKDGVMVLAVYPNSPAEQMGLRAGDVIRSINGVEVHDLPFLVQQISPWLIDPVVVVENQLQDPARRQINFKGKIPPLGIIPTPHPGQVAYMRFKDGFLRERWQKWRSKRK